MCLLPDLLSSAELVGQWVVFVRVLVEDVGIRQFLDELPGNTDVALGAVPSGAGRCTNDLGAERLQNSNLLRAHLLR